VLELRRNRSPKTSIAALYETYAQAVAGLVVVVVVVVD
jgi:hypothetical protein